MVLIVVVVVVVVVVVFAVVVVLVVVVVFVVFVVGVVVVVVVLFVAGAVVVVVVVIRTSKSGPRLWCFVRFDFNICFAPQRCALFRHVNFQKWSGTDMFCNVLLPNVLRATTACTFSTS